MLENTMENLLNRLLRNDTVCYMGLPRRCAPRNDTMKDRFAPFAMTIRGKGSPIALSKNRFAI